MLNGSHPERNYLASEEKLFGSSALQQTATLVELGHVQCVSTVSELVQVHPRLLPQRIADRRKYTFSAGPGLALNLQSTVRRRRT